MKHLSKKTTKQNSASTITIDRRIALLFLTATFVMLFILVGNSITGFAKTKSHMENLPSYKYYTSIAIHSGDSLWTIADKYISDEYKNKSDYIDEVRRINHLTSDYITAGEYIMIPYYSTEIL